MNDKSRYIIPDTARKAENVKVAAIEIGTSSGTFGGEFISHM